MLQSELCIPNVLISQVAKDQNPRNDFKEDSRVLDHHFGQRRFLNLALSLHVTCSVGIQRLGIGIAPRKKHRAPSTKTP